MGRVRWGGGGRGVCVCARAAEVVFDSKKRKCGAVDWVG